MDVTSFSLGSAGSSPSNDQGVIFLTEIKAGN